MHVIVFYYKHHTGLLELMFDDDDHEHAVKILRDFTEAIRKPEGGVLQIKSKYGVAVLNLDHYSSAVLSNLEKTEELQVMLGVRRGKVEQKAKDEFEKWAKTRDQLKSGGRIAIPSSVRPHH